jgi:hypothetical protein
LYGSVYEWMRHPVHSAAHEAHHLHEIERVGESGETPFIALLGVFLFLVPILATMMLLAAAAAWISGS